MSDAKKMKVSDDHDFALSRPLFEQESNTLWERLEGMSEQQMMDLMKCSKRTLSPVWEQLERSRNGLHLPESPAVLSYEGIAFSSMAPHVFTDEQFAYLNSHLRILSGLYGLLRPMDAVHPYRLEMGVRLHPNLYAFWGSRLAEALEDDVIVNLASREYSKVIAPYRPLVNVRFFEEDASGKRQEKGVYAKIARGIMVRWMAENRIESVKDLEGFCEIGYCFDENASKPGCLVFVRKETHEQSNF